MTTLLQPRSEEHWRPIPGFESYEASNRGRIRRARGGKGAVKGRVLKPQVHRKGYRQVQLYRDGKPTRLTVHAAIALTFLGPRPAGHEINHLDGDRSHNDVVNLEYCTSSENHAHASEELGAYRGEANSQARLSAEDVVEIRARCARGTSQREVASQFGISQPHVSDIVNGKRWAHG